MSLAEHLEDFCFERNLDLTPSFRLDVLKEKLIIEGNISAFHSHDFYEPVWQWLSKFLLKPQRNIEVNIKFKKLHIVEPNIWHFLSELNHYHQMKGEVKVFWHYPKHQSIDYETGLDYLQDFAMPFEMIGH